MLGFSNAKNSNVVDLMLQFSNVKEPICEATPT